MSDEEKKAEGLTFEWAPSPLPARPAKSERADVFSSDFEHGAGRTSQEWLGDEAAAIPLDGEAAPPLVARASFPPPQRSPSDPALRRPVPPRASALPELIVTEQRYTDPPSPFALGGRIGRVRYLVRGALLPMIAMSAAPVLALVDPWLGLIAGVLTGLLALVLSVSATVARLHDLGLHGGFVVFPVVAGMLARASLQGASTTMLVLGAVLSLLSLGMSLGLALVSGNAGDNAYGAPVVADTPTYRIVAIILALALGVELLALNRIAMSLTQ